MTTTAQTTAVIRTFCCTLTLEASVCRVVIDGSNRVGFVHINSGVFTAPEGNYVLASGGYNNEDFRLFLSEWAQTLLEVTYQMDQAVAA
jgi:hypothetical protein